MPSTPIVKTNIEDISSVPTAADRTLNLLTYFDDPFTTGLTARFELENQTLGGGITNVLLYDQAGSGAPLSVQNFLNYVNDGDYVNSIIHRSIPGFIVQGGGFVVNNLASNLQTAETRANAVSEVPADAAVQNEFSAARSNTRGTLAYAKLGNNPNSATNQWFFNLADNSSNLNNQNGGFTVFGEVISEADLNAVDAIATLPRFNATTFFSQSAFSDLPLIVDDPENPSVSGDQNLVRYQSITTFQQDELSFSILNNSNPNLLNLTLQDEQLTLDYQADRPGVADITVQATNLQGQTVADTFRVRVESPIADIKLTDFNNDENSDVLLRSTQNGAAQVISLNQTQLAQIQSLGPGIQDTSWEIQGSGQFDSNGIADWVWRNQQTGQNILWLVDGSQQATAIAIESVTDQAWQIHGTGDLNGDDQSDLIWFNETTSEAAVWYINNGQRTGRASLQVGSVSGKTIVGSGDFDGDGDFELLWQDTQTAALSTQEFDNLTGSNLEVLNTSADTEGIANGWILGAIADYTVDGRSDIAWYNESQGQIKIWEVNNSSVVNVSPLSVS